MGVVFSSFLGMMLFPFRSLENSVLLTLEKKGLPFVETIYKTNSCYLFLAFGMCFCGYCYSMYGPIYYINHSKVLYGLLQQTCWILRRGRGRDSESGTGEQPLPDNPLLLRSGETNKTWR